MHITDLWSIDTDKSDKGLAQSFIRISRRALGVRIVLLTPAKSSEGSFADGNITSAGRGLRAGMAEEKSDIVQKRMRGASYI